MVSTCNAYCNIKELRIPHTECACCMELEGNHLPKQWFFIDVANEFLCKVGTEVKEYASKRVAFLQFCFCYSCY